METSDYLIMLMAVIFIGGIMALMGGMTYQTYFTEHLYNHYLIGNQDDWCKTKMEYDCGVSLTDCKSGAKYECVINLKDTGEIKR